MIRATRDWFRRNRVNLSIGAGVLTVGYLAGQYVVGKITEARQRMSDDRIARENLRRRFEQNQEDCTYTVLALLPTATDNIMKELPTESIAQELRQQRSEKLGRSAASSEIAPSDVASAIDDDQQSFATGSYIHASQIAHDGGDSQRPKKTKAQLWNELKISSITRAFTLVYTLCLLTLLTRIQLNLLGRRNYLSSVVSLAAPPIDSSKISLENNDDDNLEQEYGNDFETNRRYLTFSWWLLHRGWKDVMNKVQTAVKEVFGPVGLKEDLHFARLAELVIEVRRKVEGATEEERSNRKWLSYLLPSQSDEISVLQESGIISTSPPSSPSTANKVTINHSLRRLLDETSDLIDSPSFTHVLTQMLDSAFSQLIDKRIAHDAYETASRLSALNPNNATSETLFSASNMPGSSRIEELPDGATTPPLGIVPPPKVKLATLLASFTKAAHAIGAAEASFENPPPSNPEHSFSEFPASIGMGNAQPSTSAKDANEYLNSIEAVGDLEAFAAVVYSSNFEFEGVDITAKVEEQQQADVAAAEASIVHVGREFEHATASLETAWGRALAGEGGDLPL